jgi:hypothetical protein
METQSLYPCPPRIQIIHHELHHEVLGPIKASQEKTARAHPEDRDIIRIEHDLKAEPDVKALRHLKVFGGHKRSGNLGSGGKVRHARTLSCLQVMADAPSAQYYRTIASRGIASSTSLDSSTRR